MFTDILWTSIRSAETSPHLTFLINRMQKTDGGKSQQGYPGPYQEIGVTVITAQVENSGLVGPQLLEEAVKAVSGCPSLKYRMETGL